MTGRVPQEVVKASELLKGWQEELDQYYEVMKSFDSMTPDVALRKLASMTARFSEIRSKIVRLPTTRLDKFRTQEVDYFLSECDRQFKIWSRLISSMQLEYEQTRGY